MLHTRLTGSAATVAIRPEKIRILRPGDAVGADEVSVDATVREVVYAGSETRIVVESSSGLTLTALQLNVGLDGPQTRTGTIGDAGLAAQRRTRDRD